jgi:HlyD family secretion protein
MNEILAFLTGLVAIVIPGFGAAPVPSWNGYVEAEYVYVSAPSAGPIATFAVDEGSVVAKGDVLFALDDKQHRALVEAAEARVAAAAAARENLTTGSRQDEKEVIRASLRRAEADLALARTTADRSAKLFNAGVVPQSQLDRDNATLAAAVAAVSELDAQLKVAELPGRDAQLEQADGNLIAAKADAQKAMADLADRTIVAPVAGYIERLFYRTGEVAAAGAPVISLLPADSLKVKFYVAEADRQMLALGQDVAVTCDGCPDEMRARVSYFASEPQFTPPIIYSREERKRLTFLAEATLELSASLLPGQPVTVERLQ